MARNSSNNVLTEHAVACTHPFAHHRVPIIISCTIFLDLRLLVPSEVKGVIQFVIKGSDNWVVDLKNGSGSVYKGKAKPKADMTMTVSADDFVKMSTGSLNAQQAFMQGKIKIKGNMGLAMKLGSVLNAAK